MKSSSDIINQIKQNSNSKLYLYCQPISSAPPKDKPNIIQISKNYWSAKLVINMNNSIISLSEWFSIPIRNIQNTLQNSPTGPLFISLNNLHTKELNKLFLNAQIIFEIQDKINNLPKI